MVTKWADLTKFFGICGGLQPPKPLLDTPVMMMTITSRIASCMGPLVPCVMSIGASGTSCKSKWLMQVLLCVHTVGLATREPESRSMQIYMDLPSSDHIWICEKFSTLRK